MYKVRKNFRLHDVIINDAKVQDAWHNVKFDVHEFYCSFDNIIIILTNSWGRGKPIFEHKPGGAS